jgi:2-iminobutanoate/2-iminopropanoate deaminase
MAAFTLSNPDGVRAPISSYSHAALIAGPPRRLVISGQVGIATDGSIPEAGDAQVAQAFANLRAILEAHGMSFRDLITTACSPRTRPRPRW